MIVSEWTKLRSVRSTRWSLLVATVLTIGFPILASAVISSHWGHRSPGERANFNPLDPALIGSQIAQLAIGILGVLVITGEYSTGMIRATFTAVPKRLPVLWAKAFVFALVTFVLMLPSVLIAFFASQSILSRHHANIAWSHPGVARAVIGAALYLTVIAVMTLGIGTILRNTAGGIAAFAAIFFVHPAADERPAAELERRDLAVPPEQRRPRDPLDHARRALARPVDRLCAVLRLRSARARRRRRAARSPRHVAQLGDGQA